MKVITTHLNADFDSLASMLAAKKLYPEAALVFPGALENNLREFLSLLQVSIDIKKVKEIKLEEIDTLILVDTKLASRIGVFAGVLKKTDVHIHIYDHHPSHAKDIHGEIEVIKEVGATVTLLVQILEEKGIDISPEEATIFALGVYEDTGFLTFNSTTSDDLIIAAHLRSYGAQLEIIADFINKELTAEQVCLLNEAIKNKESIVIQDIEVVITMVSINKYVGDISILAHKLRDMENISVLFLLVRMEDRIHIVARSRLNDVDVNEIVSEFGGGGHSGAASATIKNLTLIQVKERLISSLKKNISSPKSAGEIMSSPVK